MLKKFIAAFVVTIMLSACGAEVEDSPKPTMETLTPEQQYILDIQENSTAFADVDEDQLIDAAHQTCDYFYEFGANSESVVTLMSAMSAEFGVEESSIAVAAAVRNFCPEFAEPIKSLSPQSGSNT